MFGFGKAKEEEKEKSKIETEEDQKSNQKPDNDTKRVKKESLEGKQEPLKEKQQEEPKKSEEKQIKTEDQDKEIEKQQEETEKSEEKQIKTEDQDKETEKHHKEQEKSEKKPKKDQDALKKEQAVLEEEKSKFKNEQKMFFNKNTDSHEEKPEKIVDLFRNDPKRLEKFSHTIQIGDEFIYFDYSKTHIKPAGLSEMFKGFSALDRKSCMFNKERINFTEGREVLHVCLRDWNVLQLLKLKDGKATDEKEDILEKELKKLGEEERLVFDELLKMKEFDSKFANGELKGVTGKQLKTVVSIGIGGSDLGPRAVNEALEFYKRKEANVHFVSNVDPVEMLNTFQKIDPEETLFIVVSKTFTTQETMSNAQVALKLIEEKTGKSCAEIAEKQFVAVSANVEAVKAFGSKYRFDMWDWVGGRFSVWSAVGLSVILNIGFENYVRFLQGASYIDEHFRETDNHSNVPVIQALIEIFYSDKMDYNNKCIVAYDEYLKNFYLHLQQLEMESNGKCATLDGITTGQTCMLIWGGVGTNTQHSFFQLLHQGTRKVLMEFLVPLRPLQDKKVLNNSQFEMLFANCLGQSRALMLGENNSKDYKFFPGDRPSITIAYSRLTPEIVGALIAFTEHKVYIQGLYWKINSFDQFGVTLGKSVAVDILKAMDEDVKHMDTGSMRLLGLYKELNDRESEK
ncbi:Glucose-6-phosphate isomerase [Pseudoloma neurophilia]|uniref:Glucose-6-phosphate isomerase n=1 Tax=Pseudoloma neurophilia TaxID=146866 RepID=A0A0R0M3S3_9MICR|nr:Glucose-6-phosphate isomerase [Pseudoloma neurophilia]